MEREKRMDKIIPINNRLDPSWQEMQGSASKRTKLKKNKEKSPNTFRAHIFSFSSLYGYPDLKSDGDYEPWFDVLTPFFIGRII